MNQIMYNKCVCTFYCVLIKTNNKNICLFKSYYFYNKNNKKYIKIKMNTIEGIAVPDMFCLKCYVISFVLYINVPVNHE